MKRVLLVEDEVDLGELIQMQLRRTGYSVDYVENGVQALEVLKNEAFDLVLLDWMMPEMDGLSTLMRVRNLEGKEEMPIIFLTALAHPDQICEALNCGADDYVVKPVDIQILDARIKSVLRRSDYRKSEKQSQSFGQTLQVSKITLDKKTYIATTNEEKMELTRSEFRLLQALMEEQGCVLTRKQLIEQVQGEGVIVTGRTVDTHIFSLRKKLGDQSEWIETIRGVGYRMKNE